MNLKKTGSVRASIAALTGIAVALSARVDAQADVGPYHAHGSYAAISAIIQTHVLQFDRSGGMRSRSGSATESRGVDRIIHRFDFDERGEGNVEEVPKYWDIFRPPGFPHYARGGFDFDVGFGTPPSFHLFTEGRNVAYQYTGPETRVRINSEYRIEGYIKPDRLSHGRACLSAHFLDRSGRILIDTIVSSRWIGGADDDGWVRVELHLPAAPIESFSIGLIAWVVQEPVWNPAPTVARHIPMRDVFGGAWFDDIVIYRLPRAEVAASKSGNVLASGGEQSLMVILADEDDRSVEGRLSIYAADGGLVETYDVEVALGAHAEAKRIDVSHLEPGLYQARLDVRSQRTSLLSRSLTFARLSDRLGRPEAMARSFGVVVDPATRVAADIEGTLLLDQRVHSVKLPVWTGLPDDGGMGVASTAQRSVDRLHQTLLRNNFAVTAVLHGPPSAMVRSAEALALSLADLLSSPGVWEPYLAAVAAPHAGTYRWWQIGADQAGWLLYDERGWDIAGHVRSALRPFIPDPQLAASANALMEPPSRTDSRTRPADRDKPLVEQITLYAPAGVSGDTLTEALSAWRRAGFDRVAMHVPPLPGPGGAGGFDRAMRLADWAQRLITARHAGANPVFAPQTWQVRKSSTARIIEPDETFLILRTLADVVGDAEPGPVLTIADGVKAMSFRNGDSSMLAIWTTAEGLTPGLPNQEDESGTTVQLVRHVEPGGPLRAATDAKVKTDYGVYGPRREVAVQLGRATRQIDLWGRSEPLERDSLGRQIVALSAMPVLIDDVDPMLMDIASSLRVSPQEIQSGTETMPLTLDWAYAGDRAVMGRVTLIPPDGWNVTPREFDVRWMPRRIERIPVDVRVNPNEAAGRKTIVARVTLSDPDWVLEIPFHLEVDLAEIDVWGLAWLDGDHLMVRHAMTNRSRETVHFRGAAGVPGHERQYRPFIGLRPGDTQTAIYRFSNASDLVGRKIRLGLRELNDGRRSHNLELIVP